MQLGQHVGAGSGLRPADLAAADGHLASAATSAKRPRQRADRGPRASAPWCSRLSSSIRGGADRRVEMRPRSASILPPPQPSRGRA